MRRSPVVLGILLGLVVGAAAVVVIVLTQGTGATPPKVTVAIAPQRPGLVSLPHGELPDLTGRARSYRLSTTPPSGSIERLARAFDVHGAIQQDDKGWMVHDRTTVLRVQRSVGLPWSLSARPVCVMVPERGPLPTVPGRGPTPCPDNSAEGAPALALSKDDALGFGMEMLGRAGLGVSRPVITERAPGWGIDAAPLIGGRPTSGLSWRITIGPGRTVSAAGGYLAKASGGASYTLVGTSTGLARLNAASSPPGPGQTMAARLVTGAVPGLILGHVGSVGYLVPAYLFESPGPPDAPPPFVAVPAVQKRYLA